MVFTKNELSFFPYFKILNAIPLRDIFLHYIFVPRVAFYNELTILHSEDALSL